MKTFTHVMPFFIFLGISRLIFLAIGLFWFNILIAQLQVFQIPVRVAVLVDPNAAAEHRPKKWIAAALLRNPHSFAGAGAAENNYTDTRKYFYI